MPPRPIQLPTQQMSAGDLLSMVWGVVPMPTQRAMVIAMLQVHTPSSVAVKLGRTCPLLTCRVLSKMDLHGLEEEDALSLRLLTQAQALSATSKVHNAMDAAMQEVAQQRWTAFACLQNVAPSAMPLYDQERQMRLHERLQSASAAAGARLSLHTEIAEQHLSPTCS